MDDINQHPAQINSHLYMDKKRKFQCESSDLPLPKHKCWVKSPTLESDCPTEMEDLNCIKENLNDDSQSRFDQIEDSSARDSNSLSSSSVNWGGSVLDISVNSLDPKTETKARNDNFANFNDDLYMSPSFEEYQMDCGKNEECEDKVLQELLYSNGVVSNNFVLSSGRWDVNQDTQQGTENLTIDKEFEQYFSTLML